MAKLSKIRWKRSDYVTLGKAVAEFNRTIKKLETEENKLYLPEEKNYKDIKQNIQTRAELNRIIRSLKRIGKSGAGDIVYLESGLPITRYERNELSYMARSAELKLKREYSMYEVPEFPYETERQREIKAELNKIRKYNIASKDELEKEISRLTRKASFDYDFLKAERFKDNYLDTLEKYEGYANYDKLINFINKKLKSPSSFYEYVKDDMNLKDLTAQSDKNMSQNEFNKFVIEFMNLNEEELEEISEV